MGMPDSFSIDKQVSFIVVTFQKAVDKAILLTKRSYKHHNYWYYTARVGRTINLVTCHTTFFRADPTNQNKELLREVQYWAREVFTQAKNEAWMEFCSELSEHTSLAKMWGQVSIVMGRSKPKQSIHADPHQRATELIKEFASRAAGHALPAHVIELQNTLRPLREDIIMKASNMPDPVYDHPFTAAELTRAVQEGRDTAPESDGIRLSHLTHMGTVASAALLDLDQQHL